MFFRNIPVFYAMLRNVRSRRINRAMKGHSITRRIGPITRKDILLYADATLDNPARYSSRNCTVPPFYLSRLLFPMIKYFLLDSRLELNLFRLVHGQQSVEWLGEIHEGDTVDAEMSISDISDTPAGEMIRLRTFAGVKGKTMLTADSSFIIRRKERNAKQKKAKPAPAAEIFRKKIITDRGQPVRYAMVSGDTNFIHTSPLFARLAGLPGTIMHGACVAAMTSNCLLDHLLDGDMSRMKGMNVRFAGPVIPGDGITVIGYKTEDAGRITFNAVNSSGRTVLKNGEYRFNPQP